MKKLSKKFHQGALVINTFFDDFAGKTLKLEKVFPTFTTFRPCPSLPSVAMDDRKQFQCLNIVQNNKIGALLLEFN